MVFLLWLAAGAGAGWLFGQKKDTAMGPLGDALLGLGGGVAGGAMFTGLGLGWPPLSIIGAALGGAGMVFLIGKLKSAG